MSYFDFSLVIVHDVIIYISFFAIFVELEEVGNLFVRKFLTFGGCGLIVHHFVELVECLRVVLVYVTLMLHFAERIEKCLSFC